MSNPIITKKYHFCASHKYGNLDWSEEKNRDVFDKDYNTHGHNYILEVSVSGPIDPGSGWLIDLKKLGEVVKTNVVNILDHSQIEIDIEWFRGKQPSSENILVWAWGEIAPRLERGKLHRLRLVETHSIHTDYYGPNH
ncbi:MAG: 6-carboxytetrahydropterin synthase [Candidatus Marinimicrobia bacterium]|jgi:6-pyruvoyltetrahydropterin/6-carboxytetrahydropterin synthase|nr:6-carboxytetrahydropterin synthase [Candidatus Neomarinimicrobiota bacterium]MDC0645748.1 6-carboxytetrahydropterin synthase [bacterium]MBT4554774.1 6-carboxytetrahydropterin synthase [Candidatus Neomarinimicrobiota bacterium]MBT5747778.1 6-carboxytetrahydropterin synthase [Candidatus Neomarinimicrobiota bacterium]MBT6414450.1 6-carboxytetrahydropterin synthase [Candidatus Neomarinimicrobiota bacterium]|tara:strand:+ start:22430 stop:22843 length:414 start_codon:yes stop_codon:yes gene_type:complete